MASQTLFGLIAAAGAAACSSAPAPGPEGSGIAIPGSLSPAFPREAVDHVATYASFRGWGPRDGDRATIARHGGLVRLETRLIATHRPGVEAAVETSFANIATGASMSLGRDAEGAIAGATLWQGRREADLPAWRRRRLTRTAQSEQILGERCTIWRAEPEAEGPAYTACIAADGVVLRDTVLYRDGSVMSERLALSVERRPVASAEVLPPREVLDWGHWLGPSPARRQENYALSLATRNGNGAALQRIFLSDGVAKSEEQRTGGELTSLGVTAPGVGLGYHGAEPQLSLSRVTGSPGPGPAAAFGSAPLAERLPLRLLGETCSWFNAAVGVSDYGRIECRTADGLPLVIEEYSRGSSRGRWEAVSLTRGRTPAGSVRPPADLLSWRRWGWPMLERR